MITIYSSLFLLLSLFTFYLVQVKSRGPMLISPKKRPGYDKIKDLADTEDAADDLKVRKDRVHCKYFQCIVYKDIT